MKRRSYLAVGVALGSSSTGGCLAYLTGRDDPWTREDPCYPDDCGVPADAATHDLYVENYDDVSSTVTVTVVRKGDEALIWRSTYEVPAERGFYVPGVLVADRTYDITVELDDEQATVEQAIKPCPPRYEAGSANVGARIEDGAITYHRDSCDEIRVGLRSAENHEQFVVE